ncbi:MAG: XRE family transcriptional regulator [Aestuariibacter sp.]|nr:XRE family transcriptional regulator [Aestuariibacter sp.]|tara:strand:+ start:242493 stop:242711 length:219 start_codon:yes stop_codon:yes gene_type:complete
MQPNLKDLRKELKVKQEVIAAQMRVSDSSVSKLEGKEIKQLSVTKLAAYVEALGGHVELSLVLPNGERLNVE